MIFDHPHFTHPYYSLIHPPKYPFGDPIHIITPSLASLSRASRASMPRDPSRDIVAGQARRCRPKARTSDPSLPYGTTSANPKGGFLKRAEYHKRVIRKVKVAPKRTHRFWEELRIGWARGPFSGQNEGQNRDCLDREFWRRQTGVNTACFISLSSFYCRRV